jgi:hypothetical protein
MLSYYGVITSSPYKSRLHLWNGGNGFYPLKTITLPVTLNAIFIQVWQSTQTRRFFVILIAIHYAHKATLILFLRLHYEVHVRNKNNIPRICEMQNGEEHTKEKIHTTQNLRGSPLGLRPQSCSDLSL